MFLKANAVHNLVYQVSKFPISLSYLTTLQLVHSLSFNKVLKYPSHQLHHLSDSLPSQLLLCSLTWSPDVFLNFLFTLRVTVESRGLEGPRTLPPFSFVSSPVHLRPFSEFCSINVPGIRWTGWGQQRCKAGKDKISLVRKGPRRETFRTQTFI